MIKPWKWICDDQKRPKQSGVYWRWILVEPGHPEGRHDLPKWIFDRLRGNAGEPQHWLYRTYHDAVNDLVRILTEADEGD